MHRRYFQEIELDQITPLDCSNAQELARLSAVLEGPARMAFDDLETRFARIVDQGNPAYDDGLQLLRLMFWHAYANTELVLALIGRHCLAISESPDYPAAQRRSLFQLTGQVFIPVVELMGMWRLRRALGNMSLQEVRSKEYSRAMQVQREVRQRQFPVHNVVRERLWEELRSAGIDDVEISEHISSTFRFHGNLRNGKKQGDLSRRLVFDVLAPSDEACYLMPLFIHRLWEPSSGGSRDGRSFRDLIAVSRFNGYRCLITTVAYHDSGLAEKTAPVEFRIRSREIERVNLDGFVASQFGVADPTPIPGTWWFDEDLIAFVSSRPLDSVTPELFVFSPRGKAYRDLPRDSTPIDYAYSVHTDIGNHCKRIWVNGARATYSDTLQNGQIVKIDADSSYQGPEKTWLHYVETPNAKSQIRRALQRRRKPRGREIIDRILDNELQWHGFELGADEVTDHLDRAARELGYLDVNAFYLDVADQELSPERIVNSLITEKLHKHIRSRDEGVALPDRIDFARCFHNRTPCRVTPGTPIVGRLVRSGKNSNLLKVYRTDCPNAPQGDEAIPLTWLGHRQPGDIVRVSASAVDRSGLLGEMLAELYRVQDSTPLSIIGVHANVSRDRSAEIEMDIETPDTCSQDEISRRLQELKQQGVLDDYHLDPLSPIDRVLLALPDSLPNPYTTGPANWRLFKGRESERQQLAHYLRATENFIVVVGGNRIGKTSLLRYAETHLVPELNLVPVMMDMQGLPGQSEDYFWTEMANCIDGAYSRKIFGFGGEWRRKRSTVYAEFMRILGEKRAYLNRRPVVMIDEVNVVDDLWDEDEARALVQHLVVFARRFSEFTLVLSLQEDLYRAASMGLELPTAGLLDTGTRIRLGYLSQRATRQVVVEPVQSMLDYEDAAVERIVGLTAGHPYYLQRMLERVVERAAVEKCSVVTEEWLVSVLEQIFDSQHEFHDFLRKTRGFERTVLVALADCCAAGKEEAKASDVADVLHEGGAPEPPNETERALERLYLAGVIQRNDELTGAVYRIDVPLFQEWLVRTRLASLQSRSIVTD